MIRGIPSDLKQKSKHLCMWRARRCRHGNHVVRALRRRRDLPKLPVYLRSYHATFERNARVRDAVKLAERGNDALRALNAATLAATAAAAIGGEAAVVEPSDGEPANGTSAARAADDAVAAPAAASGATADATAAAGASTDATAAAAASDRQMTRRAAAAANTAAVAIAAAAATVPPPAEGDGASAATAATAATAAVRAVTAAAANSGATGSEAAAATRAAALAHLFPPIAFAPRLPRPPEEMLRVLGASPVFVGGCAIGGAPAPPPPLEQQQQRGRGKRGRNRAPRAAPHCKR